MFLPTHWPAWWWTNTRLEQPGRPAGSFDRHTSGIPREIRWGCSMQFWRHSASSTKWLVFSPSSGPGHLLMAQSPSPAAWHMVQHCLQWSCWDPVPVVSRWFKCFSPTLWCFSPSSWCFLQVQAQGMYLLIGAWLLPLGIWYHTVWSCWVQAIINGCVLCFWAFKMHFFSYGWCLHTFFFKDKGECGLRFFSIFENSGKKEGKACWVSQLPRSKPYGPKSQGILIQSSGDSTLH